jgi:hypothetical protein
VAFGLAKISSVGNAEDSHDDVNVPSPNIDYPVSSENSRPVRDRRTPQRYGVFEDDKLAKRVAPAAYLASSIATAEYVSRLRPN